MGPILAKVANLGASPRNGDGASGFQRVQGSKQARDIGKVRTNPAESPEPDPSATPAFSSVLQESMARDSQDSASGNAVGGAEEHAAPVCEPSPKLEGKRESKDSTLSPSWQNFLPDLAALLKGMGLSEEQAKELCAEIEHTRFRSSGAGEQEEVGKDIAAILGRHGIAEKAIPGLLNGIEQGNPTSPVPPKEREREPGAPGNPIRSAKGGAPREVTKGFMPEAQAMEGDDRAPVTVQGRGREAGDPPAKATAVDRPAFSMETEAAKSHASRETNSRASERPSIDTALPSAEMKAGKDAPIKEAVPVLPDSRAAGRDALDAHAASVKLNPRRPAHPAAEDKANEDMQGGVGDEGVIAGRDIRGLRPAAGKDGSDLRLTEYRGPATGKDKGEDNAQPVSAHTATARDVDAAGRFNQVNLSAASGGVNETKMETTAGLRPDLLIDQIVTPARQVLQNPPGRMKITLNPPQLGTIDMDVLVRSNKVEVVMVASNQEVQQVLKSHADQLKSALQGQGLRVDGFDVMLSGNQGDPGYRFRSGDFAGRGGEDRNLGEEEIEAGPSGAGVVSPGAMIPTGTNGDGISLYA